MAEHFADELFHLVGRGHSNDDEHNFATLISLLRDRCISYERGMKNWGQTSVTVDPKKSLLHNELVVPNMVCFCDILPTHLADHVSKYGRFGVSIAKSYAIRYGVRPVMYIPFTHHDRGSPYGTELLREIEAAFNGLRAHLDPVSAGRSSTRVFGQPPKSKEEAIEAFGGVLSRDLVGFVKAFDSELPDNHLDYFYAEKEWRRLGNLMFKPEHVKHVAVAPGFEQPLLAECPEYAEKLIHLV